jgi:putative aminopeptidase FrvX
MTPNEQNSLAFLKQLLNAVGPSGDEANVSKIWREEAKPFSDKVYADMRGNSYAVLEAQRPRVMLAGHIDEIGVMIKYIHDNGFLSFAPIGHWNYQVFIGQRIRLSGYRGEVLGVIGHKPQNLLYTEESDNKDSIKLRAKDLWIDIGARSREEASAVVRVGDTGVIDAPVLDLPNDRIVARSVDNRVGAFAVLEVIRRLSKNRPIVTVGAVATVHEETFFAGAITSTFSFEPNIAIVVDVIYTTDCPNLDKSEYGEFRLGYGPVIGRGGANNPRIFNMLVNLAEHEKIQYNIVATPMSTESDAEATHISKGGVATGTIFIPCRYMHTPNEIVDIKDVEESIRLILAFIYSLSPESDFV